MSLTLLEEAIGTVDGVNRTYFTQTPYVPGTVRLWLNGQLLLEDCLVEVNPNTGEVLLDPGVLPRPGDIVQLLWRDAASVLSELDNVVTELFTCIEEEVAVYAEFCPEEDFTAYIALEDGLLLTLTAEMPFYATVEEEVPITGILQICDDPA